MFHEGVGSTLWYKEDFMAARPRASLIKALMNMIKRMVKEEVWPYPKYLTSYLNPDTFISSFPGMTQALINFLHREGSDLCENYGVQSFHANSPFMVTVP